MQDATEVLMRMLEAMRAETARFSVDVDEITRIQTFRVLQCSGCEYRSEQVSTDTILRTDRFQADGDCAGETVLGAEVIEVEFRCRACGSLHAINLSLSLSRRCLFCV